MQPTYRRNIQSYDAFVSRAPTVHDRRHALPHTFAHAIHFAHTAPFAPSFPRSLAPLVHLQDCVVRPPRTVVAGGEREERSRERGAPPCTVRVMCVAYCVWLIIIVYLSHQNPLLNPIRSIRKGSHTKTSSRLTSLSLATDHAK